MLCGVKLQFKEDETMKRGLFISIEGTGEGVGKTTVINGLKSLFKSDKFYFTREIGGIGSPVAEAVRKLTLSTELPVMDKITEELLVLATRTSHMHDVVFPKLVSGTHVICDRCMLSSMAYQGHRGGNGIENVYNDHVRMFERFPTTLNIDNTFKTVVPVPDVIYVLRMPVEDALKRLSKGRDAKDMNRIDLESKASHTLIHEGYLKSIEYLQSKVDDPDSIVFIDASDTPEAIIKQIGQDIAQRIGD
jgi:dTMP kinase